MDEQEILKIFQKDLERYPRLPEAETQKLLLKYKEENDQEALEKLTLHNLGLALKIARKYQNGCKSMSYLDLIQENYLILRGAIKLFDINKGNKLSTYLCASMKMQIQRSIDNQDKTIRIPASMSQKIRKYKKYTDYYYQEYGKNPTEEEIELSTGITPKEQKSIEKTKRVSTLSLNEKVDEDKEEELTDLIADQKNSITEVREKEDTLILLRSLCDFLDKREYYILYYSVLSPNKVTRDALGAKLEITPVRVGQIEKKALEKIKPVINKIQAITSATYRNNIDTRELVPLEPKKRLALYYLKHNMNELPYHVIYTKLCNPEQDNLEYYKSEFPQEEQGNLESTIERMPEFMDRFLTEEIMEKVYSLCRNDLTILQILELNITPKEKSKDQKESAEFMNFLTSDDLLMQILTSENKESKEGTIVKTPYTK